MHGVPVELVENATADQLNLLWKIVSIDEKERLINNANATGAGVWGTKK